MITGTHLVLMDGIHHTHNIAYRHPSQTKAHGEFCIMPPHWFKEWNELEAEEKYSALGGSVPMEDVGKPEHRKSPCCTKTLVPCLKWTLLALTIFSPAAALACGSTEFFCGMHVEA